MSSEKGLLYYLHEPIYVSKSSGFSTIPQGCTPHLSPDRAPLSARRTGKGERQQGLKERLGCLHHVRGDPRWVPTEVSLAPLDASQSPFRPGSVRQRSFLPCYVGRTDCLFFSAAVTITTTTIRNPSTIISTIARPLPPSASMAPSPHHHHRTTNSSITIFPRLLNTKLSTKHMLCSKPRAQNFHFL